MTRAKAKGRRTDADRMHAALCLHESNERRLTRAMNAWQKSRAALHRLEKRLDRKVLGGDLDWTDPRFNPPGKRT